MKKPHPGDKKVMKRYGDLLTHIKARIRQAQNRAVISANAEMLRMYWDIGRMITVKQGTEGWGAAVIPRLSVDLRSDLPEIKGFSERNIGRMIAFFRAYPGMNEILPQPVAKLNPEQKQELTNLPPPVAKMQQAVVMKGLLLLVPKIPWGHNILLMEKVKDLSVRQWYVEQVLEDGWTRAMLAAAIKTNAHKRQGAAVTNFDIRLPEPHAQLAKDTLKDPYIFDFLTLDKPFRERELEAGLVQHLERFLLELGTGFAFVGRQVHLDVAGEDFYIDLLFYHLRLRSFIVVDLKIGPFKPEYAGKINFYCNVVDDQYRYETDNPTIGLMQDLLTCGIDERGNLRSEQTHPFKDSPLGRIPEEWEVKSADELCDAIIDCKNRTPTAAWEGHPVIRNKGTGQGDVSFGFVIRY